MDKLVLYTNKKSPPCRAVKLTARALGIELIEKEMTLMRGDKLMEEFLKVNPQQTIPVLDDGGIVITASHAIMIYLEPVIYSGKSYFHSDRVEHIRKAYRLLEDSLVNEYMVGNSLTIADFSCISSVASLVGVVPLDETKFPKIVAWIKRMQELPYYEEANGNGALELAEFVLGKKEANASQYL